MNWVALGFAVAVAVAVIPAGREALADARLLRRNYRGRSLPYPLGAAVVVSAVVSLAVLAPLDGLADQGLLVPELGRWMPYILGVAFLGLFDDILGRGSETDSARGWRGHARAIAQGRLSTGAVKAIGSLGLAAFVLQDRGVDGWQYVADIALLLLATNLMNLFDTAPGRTEKVFALLATGLSLGAWTLEPLKMLGPFVAPVAVASLYTVRERAMLGDTGSNVVGALAGIWLILTLGDTGRLIALAVILAITIYGEFRSLGKFVERVPLLRALDSVGRVH
jgi:UDP-GlcNAc:undecaprenyl-phosphate/decaprenyl-phosphate GlcNAc-1-phosphate transferase